MTDIIIIPNIKTQSRAISAELTIHSDKQYIILQRITQFYGGFDIDGEYLLANLHSALEILYYY